MKIKKRVNKKGIKRQKKRKLEQEEVSKEEAPKQEEEAPKQEKTQILSYPIPIRQEKNKIVYTLEWIKKCINKYLEIGYNEKILEALSERRKGYKILETLFSSEELKSKVLKNKGIPSRIHRGILEIGARTLRAVQERKKLWETLIGLNLDPKKWNYKDLITKKGVYVKAQQVENLKEQTLNFVAKKDKMPEKFTEMQKFPQLNKPLFTYAPDDGQAIKMSYQNEHIQIKMKVAIPKENAKEVKEKGSTVQEKTNETSKQIEKTNEIIEKESELEEVKWEWIRVSIPIPEKLREKGTASPDLRLACNHGNWLPVLDYKIKVPYENKKKSKNFLTIDWGTRKLVSMCVFNTNGQQITKPIFVKFEPIKQKLLRIREEISCLKSKRDKLEKDTASWQKYNRQIAILWHRFRGINKNLAHMTSNIIILTAQFYGCTSIFVEYLKSLKSKDKSAELNWIINTTVRQAIYNLVEYKGKLCGIKLEKPLNPFYTSQFCPRCSQRGHHVKSPNHKTPCKGGGWFVCLNCHYQADRDYVATCNLARKVLYGNSLKKAECISYKECKSLSHLPFRGSNSFISKQFVCNLKGWHHCIRVSPYFFAG